MESNSNIFILSSHEYRMINIIILKSSGTWMPRKYNSPHCMGWTPTEGTRWDQSEWVQSLETQSWSTYPAGSQSTQTRIVTVGSAPKKHNSVDSWQKT